MAWALKKSLMFFELSFQALKHLDLTLLAPHFFSFFYYLIVLFFDSLK